MTPMHLAVKENKLKVVQYLVSVGVDVQAKTRNEQSTPMHIAGLFTYSFIIKHHFDLFINKIYSQE